MRRVMAGGFQALRQHKDYCAMLFILEEATLASTDSFLSPHCPPADDRHTLFSRILVSVQSKSSLLLKPPMFALCNVPSTINQSVT